MFPNVLRKNRINSALREEGFPTLLIRQVQDILVCSQPAFFSYPS